MTEGRAEFVAGGWAQNMTRLERLDLREDAISNAEKDELEQLRNYLTSWLEPINRELDNRS